MSEPTNPLFEEEKAFLERKKLEYERALRGDVAHLKQQTADAGRVALVAGGLAGSVWLITKLFTTRKRRKPGSAEDYQDYVPNGYRSQGYDSDSDSQGYDSSDAYNSHDYDLQDYGTQRFGDFNFDDEAGADAYNSNQWSDADDYFGHGTEPDESPGAVYHTESSSYDSPGAQAEEDEADDLDDNGLHSYPNFPEHSSHQHGDAPAGEEAQHFESEAYGHPESTLPFDDSRRLPESNEFAASAAEPREATDHIDQYPGRAIATPPAREPKTNLGTMLLGFAKSDLGKVVVGQAASLAIALATKAIKAKLPSDAPETPKNSDLADLTGENDGYAHGHPATPQPDAHYAPAAFRSDPPA